MGVVYAAFDRDKNTMVALKVLDRVDGDALLRFKREFRAVQDLAHPNVVALDELVESNGIWFFTMELVDGVDFSAYVRPQPSTELDETRLRAALAQLALGLHALHDTGRVHRDVKPSNVLVTAEGRVVLLDFGLSAQLTDEQSSQQHGVGTAAYMAPEQALGMPLDASADWYAFGALLYEALTGRLPFSGSTIEMIMDKQQHSPPPPRAHTPDAPADLDELCVALLSIDPKQRPSGRSILKRLGVAREATGALNTATHLTESAPFVGRDAELARLREAFERSYAGPVIALVRGESGLGKTELVGQLTNLLQDEVPGLVVLAGRCYERESVAYKAFDGIADALSRYMRHISKVDAAGLLPLHAGLLPRLFPILQRVEVIAQAPWVADIPDRHELRRRMFGALRELLARLAARHPVVLVIDDLHWTDDDSLDLMRELFAEADDLPLLLVATLRPTTDQDRSRALATIEQLASSCAIELEPLPDAAAQELAAMLLPDKPKPALDALVAEAQGHPLFLQELARHDALEPKGARASLDETLWSRIARLPDDPRRLLALVSVADRPIAHEVAAHAAEMSLQDYYTTVARLRLHHFLRTDGMRPSNHVSVYHDRVRELVLAHLDAERARACHERLAIALESAGAASSNPHALVRHAAASGALARAAEYAELAATHAVDAVAFDRAVEFFRTSLHLVPHDEDKSLALRLRLADALANAGRGLEAAETFLEAGAGAKPATRLDCQRRAAEQLLKSGHIDRGIAAIDDLLHQLGIRSSSATLPRFLFSRARLRLTRMRYRQRDESEIAPQVLRRLDILWSATLGTVMADHMRSADLQTRHLLLSLETGEPHRLARAFAVEAGVVSSAGPRSRRRVDRLLGHARALNEPLRDPYLEGWSHAIEGLAAYQRGELQVALDLCDKAAATWTPESGGRFFASTSVAFFERTTVSLYSLWSLYYLGRYREVRRRAFDILESARRRGDRYTETNTSTTVTTMAWLVADEVDQAEQAVETVLQNWSQTGFHLQHYWATVSRVQIALYRSDGARAWRVISDAWKRLRRSFLPIVAIVGVEAWDLRARAALAAGLLPQARHAARKLRRQKLPHAAPLASLIDAALLLDEGDTQGCIDALTRAHDGFVARDFSMHAAVANWCRGTLVGGDRGRTLVDAALQGMGDEGVQRPDRIVRLLAPGLGQRLGTTD